MAAETEYEAATGFASTATELKGKMGTLQKPEYDRLQRAADDARLKSDQAPLTLEERVAWIGAKGRLIWFEQ